MKSSLIILCFITLEKYASSEVKGEVEFFGGLESFVERDTYVFGRCQVDNEDFEKICTVERFSNIFGKASQTTCSVILETQKRNTMVGPYIKVVPFGDTRAIVKWVEKYVGESTPQELYVKLTIITFANCSRKDVEIALPLETDENSDRAIGKVYLLPNESDHYLFATFYNKNLCGNKMCKIALDTEANKVYEPEPWVGLETDIIKAIVPLKRGNTELRFLAFSNSLEAYLVNKSGSEIRKLDIYSNKNSTTVHHVPGYGLLVITFSLSDSCKEDYMQEHITLINDQGTVESHDLPCRPRRFTMPQAFYNDKGEYCLITYAFVQAGGKEEMTHNLRCIPIKSSGNGHDISGLLKSLAYNLISPNYQYA